MSYTGMTCGHAGRLCDVLPRGHPLRVHETANRTRLQTGRRCQAASEERVFERMVRVEVARVCVASCLFHFA